MGCTKQALTSEFTPGTFDGVLPDALESCTFFRIRIRVLTVSGSDGLTYGGRPIDLGCLFGGDMDRGGLHRRDG